MQQKAVYPGSFDPMTWGHVRLVEQVAGVFAEVIVAIGVNPVKKCLFSQEERVQLAQQALRHLPNVRVCAFAGLLTRFLVEQNLQVVIRGLRTGQDMDDNFMQELFAWSQNDGVAVTPFYVPSRPREGFLSSSLLKMAILEQADAAGMAPLASVQAVQARMLGQYLVGVTGLSGSGKSFVCDQFKALGAARGIAVHTVDADKLVHAIYETREEPLYVQLRQEIGAHFKTHYQVDVQDANGMIDRKKLGSVVFAHPPAKAFLERVLYAPLTVLLRQTLRGMQGLILVDAPTLVEASWLPIVNNNVLLLTADAATRTARLRQRYEVSSLQIMQRQQAQTPQASKEELIRAAIQNDRYGGVVTLTNNGAGASPAELQAAFEAVLALVDVFGEMRLRSGAA